MTKEDVVKRINAVFSTTNIPKSNDIVIDGSGDSIEIKYMFINKEWKELSQADMIDNNSALGFLTDNAFRYYLPAYMLLLLNNIQDADIVASNLVRQLTLPIEVDQLRLMNFLAKSKNTNKGLEEFLLNELKNSTKSVSSFIRKMSEFTQEQGACINSFLIYLSKAYPNYFDENEPLIASERYWFKYCP